VAFVNLTSTQDLNLPLPPMSETTCNPKERAASFVSGLRRISQDRGKLAALRRGLTDNPRLHVDAYPVLASLGGDIGNPVFLAIAAFYATHPDESNTRNIGETCRRIGLIDSKDVAESIERRFRRLLSSGNVEDVIDQLRSWIRLASSKGVSVNYESLFADLWNWRYYADDIRVHWARAFWQANDSTAETSQPATEATTATAL
jgi:CRISPR type I-E-associated protein CasB/Cse2